MKKALVFLILLTACGNFFKPKAPKGVGDIVDRVVVQGKLEAFSEVVTRENLQITTLDEENKIYVLSGKSVGGNEQQLVNELTNLDGVEFAEPVYKVRTLDVTSADVSQVVVPDVKEVAPPKDRLWMYLWHLKNYGQDSISGIEGVENSDISALKAWTVTEGEGAVVAVMDTGVDYEHPELKDSMWVNVKEKDGEPGKDNDGNGYVQDVQGWNTISSSLEKKHYGELGTTNPMDGYGHGTHVAGLIAASKNSTGVVGVAPKAKILPIKVLSDSGSGTTDDLYRGILYAYKNAKYIDVLNMSLGGTFESKLIEKGMKLLEEAKILVVAAAGNDGTNTDVTKYIPQYYAKTMNNVVVVAASTNRDTLASFSNFGVESVHIASPGVDILSTYNQQRFVVAAGTSMAAPIVSGVAALVIAANPSLKKDPVAVKKILMDNVDPIDDLDSKVASGGRLNAYKAVVNANSGSGLHNLTWTEEAYSLSTPFNPDERYDKVWEVSKDGAAYIQLHVDTAYIDSYDVLRVFDSKYNLVAEVSGEFMDQWLPPVKGDKLYLLFSNATVQLSDGSPFPNMLSMGATIDRMKYVVKE